MFPRNPHSLDLEQKDHQDPNFCNVHQHQEPNQNSANPVYFPPGVANIVTQLVDGDIDIAWSGDEETDPFTPEKRREFRLFNKPMCHPDPDATLIAHLILQGEEKNVNNALNLLAEKLAKDASYLNYPVIASDPRRRKVKGTLLQIAAMARDVNLREKIVEEKHRGVMERIISMSKLTSAEINSQLQVITSNEAKQANEKRKQRVLDAVKKLGEDLISRAKEYKGEYRYQKFSTKFQTFCKPVIDEFEKSLACDEIITSGLIFDPDILFQTRKWFEDNVDRFDGFSSNQSDVFWVNGFGKLQARLSSRDAQLMLRIFQTSKAAKNGCEVPPRTLTTSDGKFFFNPASRLGIDFYLGCYGRPTKLAAFNGLQYDLNTFSEMQTAAFKDYTAAMDVSPDKAEFKL